MAFDRSKPLSEFSWSHRVRFAFEHAKLKTVGDVLDYGQEALLRLPNFGHRSLDEVENTLCVCLTRPVDAIDLTMDVGAFADCYITPAVNKLAENIRKNIASDTLDLACVLKSVSTKSLWREMRRRLLGV